MMNKFNKTTAVIPIIVMILVFSFGAILEYRHTVDLEKKALREDLIIIQSNIEHLISARIINANGIAGLIELTGNLDKNMYDVFAKGIYESDSNVVKDVVFITDTTISYIYPEALSGEAIGVDLSKIPEQRELLLYSKRELVEVFFGPVDLVEGGRGIIVRVPVAINDVYYGQVAIVFDYDNFIDNSGLKEMAESNNIFLKGRIPTEKDYASIWSSGRVISSDAILEKVNMNNIEWVIAAKPIKGWNGFSDFFFVIVIIGIILVFGAVKTLKKEVELKAELEKLAEHDELTGLYNRRLFREDLQASIAMGRSGLVVLIDIDDFKNINDIHGHIFGDQILIEFSNAAQDVIGQRGTCYRFGGDEFLVIFEGVFDASHIKRTAREIRESIQGRMFKSTMNHITMSIGVVRYPEQGEDVNTLLKKADVAMYEAKNAGKSQTKLFVDDMLVVLDKKINIEKHIQSALADDGFEMHYQPIVDAVTEEIVSFEALIRFKDKAFSPFEFIKVAETSGLIIRLGYWILEDVLSTMSKWLEKGYDVRPVAINLSPIQLMDPAFRAYFFGLIHRYDIATNLIEIEITENVLLDNKEENLMILKAFRSAGMSVSMDDFGTGYSSLNYLTFLPIDKVKIDKSLKDQFMIHENGEILSGIIMMVHGLGYKVVAEGIESVEELERLRSLGCDQIQGYYFSRPLPEKEVEAIFM